MNRESRKVNPSETLNPYHIRSLQVTLRMLEEAIDGLETELEPENRTAILYRSENTYTPAERLEIRRLIGKIRSRLLDCRDEWDLSVEVKSLHAKTMSQMSVLWADLVDCLPDKMRRYGEVPDSERLRLETSVTELLAFVRQIMDVREAR